MPPYLQFHSWKQEEITNDEISDLMVVNETVFSGQKLLHWHSNMCQQTVMVNQPVLIPLIGSKLLVPLKSSNTS